jgi:formate dehydrogenase major subunit
MFVVGQNPGTNHPRMVSAPAEYRDNGSKIVAANPLPETGLFNFKDPQTPKDLLGKGTTLADEFLQIKVGADLAFFHALDHLVREEEQRVPCSVVDHTFVADNTGGIETYRAARLTGLLLQQGNFAKRGASACPG